MLEANLLRYAVLGYAFSTVAYFLFVSFRKEAPGRIATFLLLLGFVLHTLSLGSRIISSGRLPFANLYESMTSFGWGIVLIYLVIEYLYHLKVLGAIVVPIGFLATLYALSMNKEVAPLMPALQSNWLLAHVGVAVAAYGAFTVSFGVALLYLLKEYFKIKQLPEAEKLDDLTYKLIAFGFPFMTLVLITGAVWAEQAWGTYWSWDPKETWSLITLLIYAGYLHARLIWRWKGRTAAWLAVIGFMAVLFTYLGVSFLLSGLHSYAR